MNRIDKTFKTLASANRKALVAYLTAGDPDFETSLNIVRLACASGVDVIELGVPFSDPHLRRSGHPGGLGPRAEGWHVALEKPPPRR